MNANELKVGETYYEIIKSNNELKFSIRPIEFEKEIELNYGHWGTVYRFKVNEHQFTEFNISIHDLFDSIQEAQEYCKKLNLENIDENINKLKLLREKVENEKFNQ